MRDLGEILGDFAKFGKDYGEILERFWRDFADFQRPWKDFRETLEDFGETLERL